MERIHKIVELPTLGLILFSYTIWAILLIYSGFLPLPIWILLFGLNVTLFLSITHEVIHGHPTRNALVNRLLLPLPLGWVFPYERFLDTHLEHHETAELTDPFDDPESWYYPRLQFESMNRLIRTILTFNNTLFGRMLIGPAISIPKFYISELKQIISNKQRRWYLVSVWSQHFVLCVLMALIVSKFSSIPLWAFILANYFGLSVLLVRTFLEHQAAEDHSERTVIIEKCCPIAFLFLYNNLHAVHHEKPGIAWYELPKFYRKNGEHFRNLNKHYIYASYGEIFRKYFLKPKEEIAHPFLRDGQ